MEKYETRYNKIMHKNNIMQKITEMTQTTIIMTARPMHIT